MASRSRPPPRGPLRSTGGEVATTRSRTLQAARQNRDQPRRLVSRQRLVVSGRDNAWCSEVGRCVPHETLTHVEAWAIKAVVFHTRLRGDDCVARAVTRQRVESQLLGPFRSAPPRPLERTGEHALGTALEIHLQRSGPGSTGTGGTVSSPRGWWRSASHQNARPALRVISSAMLNSARMTPPIMSAATTGPEESLPPRL